jgi:ABC-type sugar transport system ATPase subunit
MDGLIGESHRHQWHVELRAVDKRFGGVRALEGASLKIRRASIHALIGENGAGKSTVGRIIAGAIAPDGGELLVDGSSVDYRSPHDALRDGITILGQEGALVPMLSVLENVLLGAEATRYGVVARRATRARFDELNKRLGFNLPSAVPVASLRVADRQKVEMLRAMARDARLIVLDEPTAVLTRDEAEKFMKTVRALKESGTTIVFVSHFLEEVLAVADDVTIMRDGAVVRSGPAEGETPQSLIVSMLGRSLDLTFPERPARSPSAPTVLGVRGLARAGAFADVSFEVRAGEILGIAGLVGSGRTEVARAIFGADRIDSGEITVSGAQVQIRSPRDAIDRGIVLLPESRKDEGLVMGRPVIDNVTLPHLRSVCRAGVVRGAWERRRVGELASQVGLTGGGPHVSGLSGGNQQKVLFAKWLFSPPKVFIADEPTRGVDVGAKRAIYGLIYGLAERGVAVIVISSELEEVLGLSHRVVVMRRGRVSAEFDEGNVSHDAVMRAAFAAEAV